MQNKDTQSLNEPNQCKTRVVTLRVYYKTDKLYLEIDIRIINKRC